MAKDWQAFYDYAIKQGASPGEAEQFAVAEVGPRPAAAKPAAKTGAEPPKASPPASTAKPAPGVADAPLGPVWPPPGPGQFGPTDAAGRNPAMAQGSRQAQADAAEIGRREAETTGFARNMLAARAELSPEIQRLPARAVSAVGEAHREELRREYARTGKGVNPDAAGPLTEKDRRDIAATHAAAEARPKGVDPVAWQRTKFDLGVSDTPPGDVEEELRQRNPQARRTALVKESLGAPPPAQASRVGMGDVRRAEADERRQEASAARQRLKAAGYGDADQFSDDDVITAAARLPQ